MVTEKQIIIINMAIRNVKGRERGDITRNWWRKFR